MLGELPYVTFAWFNTSAQHHDEHDIADATNDSNGASNEFRDFNSKW